MDKVMVMDKKMYEVAKAGKKIRVTDVDGIVYEGKAGGYSSGANEEDGFATFIVMDSKNPMCLGSNEIESIEVID